MSATFDTMEHTILVSKLEHYGVREGELQLMKSFLRGRKQYVEIDGIKSDTIDSVDYFTIQGSKLSYILYIYYVN